MNTTTDITSAVKSYLTFYLDREEYAAYVGNVLNIIEVVDIVKVPKAPPYMKGIINLRGRVLPVIDIKKRFDMQETAIEKNTCIVVMEVTHQNKASHPFTIGILVDQVVAVHEIEEDEIKNPPDLGTVYQSEFINGIVEKENHFIMLLDIEKIFSQDEWTGIQNNTKSSS
jgi:purine-binding chemotaxis protein CheW